MNIDDLKAQRDEALAAAERWDESTKHSRFSCISDQERSTELWRKVKNIDWQLVELTHNNHTTGAHQ